MEEFKLKVSKELFIENENKSLLDDYEVIAQLGKGGYAKVYEVKNKNTGELRACKQLPKMNIKNLDRFKREIKIMKKADHPNIIKLYDIYESKSSIYLIMEECKGGELFDRIIEHIEKKQMYSEFDACFIFTQLMSAIEYCHNIGVVHRDLKPENILLLDKDEKDENAIIKVIDFGLSQIIDSDKKIKSKVGTAYYVPPEILEGSYTNKCDVWSAGVILYIILSGEPPFNGRSDTEIYQKITQKTFNFPEKKWAKISNEAKDLISNMLCPEEKRFTARQVLDHEWFKKFKINDNSIENLSINVDMFKDFVSGSNFKKIILVYIASRLNEKDLKEMKKVFSKFDKNNDGQISFEEFKECLSKYENIEKEDIQKLFNEIDVGKNGYIDYTEFIASSLNKSVYFKEQRLFEAFCLLDKDNNGKITKEELIETLQADGSQDEEIDELLKSADINSNGYIDYKEFMQMMS